MEEFWEVYDRFKRKTGKIIKRDSENRLETGEYHLVVTGVIINTNKQILISKRNSKKTLYPGLWECNGGSVKLGENSIQATIREIYEEIGVSFKDYEGRYLGTVQQNDYFREIWMFKKDIDKRCISFNDKEVVEVKWVTIEEYQKMFQDGYIVPTGEVVINLLEREKINKGECER